jgi:hypothetical protein
VPTRRGSDIFVVDDDGHVCADFWREGSEMWWGSGWLTEAFGWHVFHVVTPVARMWMVSATS